MYYVTYSMSYTVLYFESFEAIHECSRKTYKETKRLLLQALDKIDAKEPFLGCQIGCTSDKALSDMFLDDPESPILNRCLDHTLSLTIKSLIKYGLDAIDAKISAGGHPSEMFFKTKFEAIMDFLKMADTAHSDRPEWCHKTLNILASHMTPSDSDKQYIGKLLHEDFENWPQSEKDKFSKKIKCFPKMHTPNRVRFTSLVVQLENLLRKAFRMMPLRAPSNKHHFVILLKKLATY